LRGIHEDRRHRPVLRCVAVAALTGLLACVCASAAVSGEFKFSGVVTHIVDGDTLDVRDSSGRRTRVRLIGIDTPQLGQCYFGASSSRARALALGRRVSLVGDRTQVTRDRYGRLLAYVVLSGGVDLGRTLIGGGFGRVYVFSRPFVRVATYRAEERLARRAKIGLWRGCSARGPIVRPPSPPPPQPPPPPPPPPPPSPPIPIGDDVAPAIVFVSFGPPVSGEAGSGVVTSSPAGINCSTTCSSTFPVGTVLTLTATPSSGSTFKGWEFACSGSQPTCVLPLPGEPKTVGVAFEKLPSPPPPPPHCNDGVDNDGDGLTDYPYDTGCSSTSDTSERTPLYACDNGTDNDSDGKVDYPADPGCSSPTDASELDASCHPSYPDFCIPPPPPDLNCADVAPHKDFTVRHDITDPDPHGFDGNNNGIGCES
jgi:endonuclease YncB( thermonuclease family)